MPHPAPAPSARLIATIPVANCLGEGVVWDDRAAAFRWTDVEGKRLYRLDWPSQAVSHIDLPHRLGSFALTDSDDVIIAAFDAGFARFDLASGATTWLARPDQPDGVRMNDGDVDRTGRFVAGSMVEDAARAGGKALGKLYRLAADGALDVLVDGIAISNALSWSPDGATMYHCDTLSWRVMAYDYGATGATNGRDFISCSPQSAPDGATVDAAGRLWLARWGANRVTVHGPDGVLLLEIAVPARQVTCPALGGPALDILAVTSAWTTLGEEARRADPEAGHLFLYQTDATGIATPRVAMA